MGMYHKQQVKKPTDKKEERKLLTNEHIEEGKKTSGKEKSKLLGTKKTAKK